MKLFCPIASLLIVLFASCSQEQSSSNSDTEWSCTAPNQDSIDYLGKLGCPADWDLLEGAPLTSAHGQASSVKFIFDLQTGSLYFTNSHIYKLHIDFAKTVLQLSSSQIAIWDKSQYRENADRSYVLGTLNFYPEPNLYTMQLFPGDDLASERLKTLFGILQSATWFGDSLVYVPMGTDAMERAREAKVPSISTDSLYAGLNFQSMNPGEAYGTLRKISASEIESSDLGRHDIILTNGLPNTFPVVAGVITTVFQTPLSHINVLSKNRHTPNMALKDGWNNPDLSVFSNKLVHLMVTADSFWIEEATIEEAQSFWDATGPGPAPELPIDSGSALISASELSLSDLPKVGAKAANFGELAQLANKAGNAWKVPESGFAIPFIHYIHHMQRNGLDKLVDSLLQDKQFLANSSVRESALRDLQEKIKAAPIDTVLLGEVELRIQQSGFTRMRFRSSTNAEDVDGFNGAGLYSSYTGILGSTEKPIADAMRKVWASIWNYRAFEERSYFRIDQKQVVMGVLVHRGFPDEGANGVAFTYNLYKPEYFGYVINVQAGDVSVVTPPEGVQCEQLIYYPFSSEYVGDPSIETISQSSLTHGKAVLTESEIQRLGNALRYVEYHYQGKPMDVEFKFDGNGRTLYLKQARPAP